jgi:hypothetical protein
MRVVELSNHPRTLLSQTRRLRASADERARSQHAEAMARYQARVRQVTDLRDQARARHSWLQWLRYMLAARRASRHVPGRPQPASRLAEAEEIITAGMTGEQAIATELGHAFGDDWTLLRGYSNRRGEIDHLLIGPRGIIAIEGKHLNATVHCDGDDWRFDKYDRYGNLVEQGRISDRRGRSPSVQLNEPASLLEEFIGPREFRIPVQRVVLFTHPRSRLGNCRNMKVRAATSTDYVVQLVSRLPQVLDAGQLARLEQLIIRDHRYHQARRPR